MLASYLRDELTRHGFRVTSFKPIKDGYQIRLMQGAVINVYTKKVLVQGKAIFESPKELRARLEYVLPGRITVWQLD